MGIYGDWIDFVTADGDIYLFDNNRDKFIGGISGIGLPPIDYITLRTPAQHGETLVDYRLRPSTIDLIHRVRRASGAEYWQARSELLDILRVNRGQHITGTLRRKLPDGSIRCLDVVVSPEQMFEEDETGGTYDLRAAIRFVAHNPVWYDPQLRYISFSVKLNTDLVFPFEFPFALGEGGGQTVKNIEYRGTWPDYPRIIIGGPVDTPIVQNITTGKKIELGMSIATGEQVTIDLAPGVKTVESSTRGNIIGVVSIDSNLADFAIHPHPVALAGLNSISFTGGGKTKDTSCKIEYYHRFIGL